MSCTNCGNNSCCGDCKKSCIKIYKPTNWISGQTGVSGDDGDPGVGIINIVDNGDGTFTIFLSDATDYTVVVPSFTHPDEPWVSLDQLGVSNIQFAGTPGITLDGVIGDISISLKYNVIAPNTVAIQSQSFIPVTIDTTAVGYKGQFLYEFRFPVIQSVVSGWFNGTDKKMDNGNIVAPVGIGANPALGDEVIVGAGRVQTGNTAGINHMDYTISINPTELSDGDYVMNLFHNSTANIIVA